MEEEMQVSREDLPGAAALASFYKEDEEKREFTEELKDILDVIARTGKYWHDWTMLKSLFSFRLKQVLKEYYESQMADDNGGGENLIAGETYPELVGRLDEALNCFDEGPPFTLQRLCEILLKPRSIYPNISKVSLALEKILLVTSTLPVSADPYPSLSPNSPAHENGPKQNGTQDGIADTQDATANTHDAVANIQDAVTNTQDAADGTQDAVTNSQHTAVNTRDAVGSNQDAVVNTEDATANTQDTAANTQDDIVNTDVEMIDASMDDNEKAETNEQNGESSSMTQEPSDIPCNGD